MTEVQLPKKLELARIRVVFLEPFFGSILYGIPCVPFGDKMEAAMIASNMPPTMAVDGKNLYYSEAFINMLTIDQIIGVLIHEIWHIILKHHLRMDTVANAAALAQGTTLEDERANACRKWNSATDNVINPMVLDEGHILPEGALADARYRNKTSEQVYAELPDDPPGQGGAGGSTGPDWGQVMAPGSMSESEQRKASDDIEGAVRQAAMAAKACGKLPGKVEELIRGWDEAKVDWKARFWRACDSHGGRIEDESWDKPNRRYIQHGIYLPEVISYGPGTIVFTSDTSASVGDDEYLAGSAELSAIVNDCSPEMTIFIQCDTEIQGEPQVFMDGEPFPDEIERRGRGGTRFEPPFDWIDKKGIRPQYMVYLTDGYASWPKEPNYPVIWLITTPSITAPWGTTIHLTV